MAPLLLMLSVAAQDTLTVKFIGNAAFSLSDGTTTLVTDFPYRSGAFGYMRYDVDGAGVPDDAVSVITHHHADHFDASLVRRNGWRVVGPPDVQSQIPRDLRVEGPSPVRIGAFSIEVVRTPHVEHHYSYVITWQNRRLYLTGDTEDTRALLAQRDLDIAFVTPWLLCTVTRAGNAVPAAMVVLHHQGPNEPPRGCGRPRVLRQGEQFSISRGRP